MRTAKVQLHSPAKPGDPSFIVGDIQGLLSLNALINKALDESTSSSELYTYGSEDSPIVIILTPEGFDGKVAPPYTDGNYSDLDGLTPRQVLSELNLGN